MHKRILFGLAAWLLGAATATVGSLLAVSLLGKGIGGGSAQQLTEQAVTQALASEAAESSATASPEPSRTHPARRARPSQAATPDPPASPTGTASPAATAGTASPGGTVFSSAGGEVVASCQASGAYLLSWSPLQGYEVGYVARGPAAAARVTFESDNSRVTMVVTCSAGVPAATSSTRSGDN